MSQTLRLPNYDENNIIDQTNLTAAIAAAVTSLPVANSNDFGTGGFVLIGQTGSKVSELLAISSAPSPTSVTLTTATQLQHNQGDPIYALYGDQLKIYRAADAGLGQQPPDTSFSPLATIPIDPNDALTTYVDATGGGGFWYKYTHYNSSTGNETNIASSVAVRGTFTVAYCSLDEIRREAGFRYAPYVTDDQIDEMRQAVQDKVNGVLDEFYQTPLQPPIPDSLKRICVVMAAGYLRQAQYSQISDPQVNGQDKIDWADFELDKLSMKEGVLVNKQGKALDGPGAAGGVEGWPNSSTKTTQGSSGGAPRVFRMSDIQGQPMTVDQSGNPVGNLYYGRKW